MCRSDRVGGLRVWEVESKGGEQLAEPGKMTKEGWMRRDLGLARSAAPGTDRYQEQSNLMMS